TTYLQSWKKDGWRKAGGGDVANKPLWRQLDVLSELMYPSWHWCKRNSNAGMIAADVAAKAQCHV
ncbi:unnamed protein product, partial [marine sediment metagenome]